MKELLSQKELRELALIFDTKKSVSCAQFSQIYQKKVTHSQTKELMERFYSGNFELFGQKFELKFLETTLQNPLNYLEGLKRRFFVFEGDGDGLGFKFFAQTSLLKYIINKICGGEGEIQNKKQLSFLESALAREFIQGLLRNYFTNPTIFTTCSKHQDSAINLLFSMKVDGFCMLCGLSFDENDFVFSTNLQRQKEITKAILRTKIPCEVHINTTISLEDLTKISDKKVLIFSDEDAGLFSGEFKLLSGKFRAR